MPFNSPYTVQSVMFGMKTDAGDQYLIGPAYKSFLYGIGHKKSYLGLKIHTHIAIGRFTPFLSYEMMWGDYYIYGSETSAHVSVKSRKQGKGVLGVGFMLTESINVFAGVSPQDYDPGRYYATGKTPHKSTSVMMKVSGNVLKLFAGTR